MAKKRAVKKAAPKALKKKKKPAKPKNPEWATNPPIPDMPAHVDLAKPTGCQRLRTYCLSWKDTNQAGKTNKIPADFEPHRYHAQAARFAEKFEPSPLVHREDTVLMAGDYVYLLRNKVLAFYFSANDLIAAVDPHSTKDVSKRSPAAVLLTGVEKRTKDTENHAHLWLVNGDANTMGAMNEQASMAVFPTVSFDCLLRFYPKQQMAGLAKRLASGDIRIVDFTPDEVRELTTQQKKTAAKKNGFKKLRAPEMGFELVGEGAGRQWHRSGSVLLEDTKKASAKSGTGMMHLLLGVDEESYFGCELPCAVSSIDEA